MKTIKALLTIAALAGALPALADDTNETGTVIVNATTNGAAVSVAVSGVAGGSGQPVIVTTGSGGGIDTDEIMKQIEETMRAALGTAGSAAREAQE